MKLQIGAGDRTISGFSNTDIFSADPSVGIAAADDLRAYPDNSVELLFSNAVIEHLEPELYEKTLKEWGRVLRQEGIIVGLGIPNFRRIVGLYWKDNAFNLDQVYRYAVGEIQEASNLEMYKSQIHKRFFDPDVLYRLFADAGFYTKVFVYCYPGETEAVNLGVVASKDEASLDKDLGEIEGIDPFIQLDTIEEVR